MVRSKVVGRVACPVAAGMALLVSVVLAAPAAGQSQKPPATDATRLDSILDRAGNTPPGTYIVTESGLERTPSAIPLVLQADVLRGAGNTIRVPVVVGADVPQAATVRLRLVGTSGGSAKVVATAEGSAAAGRLRLIREFTLVPGEYEIHAVVGHPSGSAFVAAVSRSRLIVPDVWAGWLAVTPVVLADETAKADRPEPAPFVFGPTAVTPAATGRFPQGGSLNVAFRVYSWAAEPNAKREQAKPDVTVEYVFYERTEKRLAFFNKIKPQRLDAGALGEAFDPASGMVTAGVRVPLASFPVGDFEMRIRVKDNQSKQSTEQRVEFSVAP